MTVAELRKKAMTLPVEQRVDLAVDLWDSVGRDLPVPEWQLRLVRERLADLEQQLPGERSAPWEEVRRRIWPGER